MCKNRPVKSRYIYRSIQKNYKKLKTKIFSSSITGVMCNYVLAMNIGVRDFLSDLIVGYARVM